MVLRGLVIAVAAYSTYGIGVTVIDGFHRQDLIVGAALLVFYVLLMRHLWPDLGEMRIPGLIYGLVLPFVFSRAVSTFFGTELTTLQSLFFSLGTLSPLSSATSSSPSTPTRGDDPSCTVRFSTPAGSCRSHRARCSRPAFPSR